jgi:hypothetical protein
VAAVGEVVEVTGAAVVAESIEEVAAPVVSTERAAARSEDRWAAPPWVRPEVLQYVGRGELVPLWVRAGVRQCADKWAAALPWVRAAERQYADQWVAAPR